MKRKMEAKTNIKELVKAATMFAEGAASGFPATMTAAEVAEIVGGKTFEVGGANPHTRVYINGFRGYKVYLRIDARFGDWALNVEIDRKNGGAEGALNMIETQAYAALRKAAREWVEINAPDPDPDPEPTGSGSKPEPTDSATDSHAQTPAHPQKMEEIRNFLFDFWPLSAAAFTTAQIAKMFDGKPNRQGNRVYVNVMNGYDVFWAANPNSGSWEISAFKAKDNPAPGMHPEKAKKTAEFNCRRILENKIKHLI